ncbi:MAG TPA: hypothetical protein VMS65_10860 [Polyangiaceae bacterium]|nr:hypothetical protein [Polyangiaceae bacterium]
MSRASVVRAVVALLVAVAGVGLAVSQAGFAIVGGAVGVRVGVPGAIVELTRALLPVIVALLVGALAIRFGIRALRSNATVTAELPRGGKLLGTTVWLAWSWLVVELLYRQLWLGWATLFGNLGASLVWSAVAVALCFVADRLVPWQRVPHAVRHLGLLVVIAVGALTALSAWSHREIVSRVALVPVAVVGLALVVSGVRRVESGPRARMLVELGLASLLLSAPIWRFFG